VGWQLQYLWDKSGRGTDSLAGLSHEQVKQSLFKDVVTSAVESRHSASTVVETYLGFTIYSLEGRFFAVPDGERFDAERLREKKYDWFAVGHTVPDVKQEIDQLVAAQNNSVSKNKTCRKERALFICNVAPEKTQAFLDRLQQYELTLLTLKGHSDLWPNYQKISYADSAGGKPDALDVNDTSAHVLRTLRERNFDVVIAPYEGRRYWDNISIETFVLAVASRIIVMLPGGKIRSYKGEDINRITYNKAYLNEMFRFVPPLKGKRILEVGCSDGLACDLLLAEEPEAIVGVDSMDAVGCAYGDAKITYFRMDASDLLFKDETFDVCYSLATLEHVEHPFAVLREMKRVTRRGGYCMAQAGPLFHSPFGHHMFGYFDGYPWIHLRLSENRIVEYAETCDVGAKIKRNRGMETREYVRDMLKPEHINGLTLQEYRLAEFMALPDVKVIKYFSYFEGEDLLTEDILANLSHIRKEDLITSGFELIFRVR